MLEPIEGGQRNFAHVPSVRMNFIRRKSQELADFLNGTKVACRTTVSVIHEVLSVVLRRRPKIPPEPDHSSKNERATNLPYS